LNSERARKGVQEGGQALSPKKTYRIKQGASLNYLAGCRKGAGQKMDGGVVGVGTTKKKRGTEG